MGWDGWFMHIEGWIDGYIWKNAADSLLRPYLIYGVNVNVGVKEIY